MATPPFPLVGHVFVLMLENHSFDHLLGFSNISGTDAESGKPTQINGLSDTESNSYQGLTYTVQHPADFSMPIDPAHEFPDTLWQLSGSNLPYDPAKGYPTINREGFVDNYVNSLSTDEGHATSNYGEILKCFAPEQLPVLVTLAKAFAVCDNWFSSLPGPTWPNRFFVHAASSGGLDHSPTTAEILEWENLGGVNFQNGTVFDQLKTNYTNGYKLYRGNNFLSDRFPNVSALKGISCLDCRDVSNLAADLNAPAGYDAVYTFIEPSYGDILNNTYKGGTSQHPLDDATGGEALIKQVYEAIRNSPLWEKSLLIITWDEHGGFYDHVTPPKAIAPGDQTVHATMNQYGFDFKQYGVRVPAVVVSPLIPAGTIDHRQYDHSSIPKTLQDLFSLTAMTERDKAANSLLPLLLMLDTPRTDAPTQLPDPAHEAIAPATVAVSNVAIPANHGSLPGFLHAALQTDLATDPANADAIKQEFSQIKTQQDAKAYMTKVAAKAGL